MYTANKLLIIKYKFQKSSKVVQKQLKIFKKIFYILKDLIFQYWLNYKKKDSFYGIFKHNCLH